MGLETWIAFGAGPLFRAALALMVLGLLRVLFLSLAALVEAHRKSEDRVLPWREIARQTFGWMFPLLRLWRARPVYSAVSVVFHAGLILTPLFLAAHLMLWRRAAGFAWPALPQAAANWLTLVAAAAAAGLFLGRVFHPGARALSRFQDLLWPILLMVPLLSGYAASNAALSPRAYQAFLLVHIYSGVLVMLLIPFTKIAHCVLLPLSQLVTAAAWKFPAGAGDRVAATLGYADAPSWIPGARLQGAVRLPAAREVRR